MSFLNIASGSQGTSISVDETPFQEVAYARQPFSVTHGRVTSLRSSPPSPRDPELSYQIASTCYPTMLCINTNNLWCLSPPILKIRNKISFCLKRIPYWLGMLANGQGCTKVAKSWDHEQNHARELITGCGVDYTTTSCKDTTVTPLFSLDSCCSPTILECFQVLEYAVLFPT